MHNTKLNTAKGGTISEGVDIFENDLTTRRYVLSLSDMITSTSKCNDRLIERSYLNDRLSSLLFSFVNPCYKVTCRASFAIYFLSSNDFY